MKVVNSGPAGARWTAPQEHVITEIGSVTEIGDHGVEADSFNNTCNSLITLVNCPVAVAALPRLARFFFALAALAKAPDVIASQRA